jgi:hypothetical protein
MDDDEFRELQERSQLILDLVEHPGWSLLVDRANVGLWAKQNLLISGGAKDFEHYKTSLAWMEGAQYVLGVPSLINEELKVEQIRRDELEMQMVYDQEAI